MKTLVITNSKDFVEIINGVLTCVNKRENLETIADWIGAQDSSFEATVIISGGRVSVEFPDTIPTHMMESLLEHFEYQ